MYLFICTVKPKNWPYGSRTNSCLNRDLIVEGMTVYCANYFWEQQQSIENFLKCLGDIMWHPDKICSHCDFRNLWKMFMVWLYFYSTPLLSSNHGRGSNKVIRNILRLWVLTNAWRTNSCTVLHVMLRNARPGIPVWALKLSHTPKSWGSNI